MGLLDRMVQNEEFAGKRALVTGGSRGIGAEIVRKLVDAGATVVTTARTEPAELPAGAKWVQGDVSTANGAAAVAEAALEVLGGVDVVVNNAGAARPYPAGVGAIPDEDWQSALDINYLAAVRLNAALLPTLRAQGSGVIVHISSSAKLTPVAPMLHYAAAKAALEIYSKGLSQELAPLGIRVNTVTPGITTTPGGDAARDEIAAAGSFDASALVAGIPLGRNGEPHDIAEAVLFLASDRAAWITGSNLIVDGGQNPAA
jgi:NAD(P)-dependent dehydrogenase (short-subunit alcohol dehydrogenase family)